ncbi:MAG TPA: 4Fe-4S dicluster domain-containing protein [Ktedonobacterales bacterium]|nr:4Fe-4S dicluster domain-containing protein [Ktedonobacterales bacterium]
MPRPASQVADELAACIRCNECLTACPALDRPITIEALNRQTLEGSISSAVMRFAQSCYQCGACVPVCPVGLHRDSMMMWLKMRLLNGQAADEPEEDASEDFYGPTFQKRGSRKKEPRVYDYRTWAARGWEDEDDEPY